MGTWGNQLVLTLMLYPAWPVFIALLCMIFGERSNYLLNQALNPMSYGNVHLGKTSSLMQ